jgi:hypothetical protein
VHTAGFTDPKREFFILAWWAEPLKYDVFANNRSSEEGCDGQGM